MSASTPTDLPFAVAAYFVAGNAHDHAAMGHCFADDGVVLDEGHEHTGAAAIEQWAAAAAAKYGHRVTLLAAQAEGDARVVTARVAGNFPGSPLPLRFFFTLRDGRIASLQIRP